MKRDPLLGYTLIEILVVIVIISIVATAALLTTRYNQTREIEMLATEISNLLTLTSEEAMLRPATLGIAFTSTTFNFYILQENKEHKPVWNTVDQAPLNLHHYSKTIKIIIKVNDKIIPLSNQPQITIPPSGDPDFFTILLSDRNDTPAYQVMLRNGNIISERIVKK